MTSRPPARLLALRAVAAVLAAMALPAASAASSCWTSDGRMARAGGGVPMGHPSLAAIDRPLDVAEAVLRGDARINAQSDVRIRLFRAIDGGQPRAARVAAKAYDRVTWGPGRCDLIPQADRIGPVTAVSIAFNEPARTLTSVLRDDALRAYAGPQPGPAIQGWPVWDGCIVMTPDGRPPWLPVRQADWAAAEARRREAAIAEYAQALRAALKPVDEAAMAPALAQMQRTDPAGAERLRASLAALRQEQAARATRPDPALTAQQAELDALRAWAAGLDAATAGLPVRLGTGRFGLASAEEAARIRPLVTTLPLDPAGDAVQVVHVCAAPAADAHAALRALDLRPLARALGWPVPAAGAGEGTGGVALRP